VRRRAKPSSWLWSREPGQAARADCHRHGRFSSDLVPRSRLTEFYAPIVTGRPAFISFQTVAELRMARYVAARAMRGCSGSIRRSRGRRLCIRGQSS